MSPRPLLGLFSRVAGAAALTLGLVATAPSDASAKPKSSSTAKAKGKKKKPTGASKKSTSAKKPAKKAAPASEEDEGSSHAIFDADYASTPASKYGALDKKGCIEAAKLRGIGFDEVDDAPGVLAPVRLTGPLNGVAYHTELAEKDRATSPYEVFDCRLVLALHDFSAILTAHHVHEAYIFSAWRPPGKSWPSGKEGTRHPGGLAVDIRVFKKDADAGSSSGKDDLVVARDWTPARGAPACGDGSKIAPDGDDAREIRAIYCQAATDRLFHSMLGPNYNKAHENHFHLEITPGVKWRLVL